MNATRTPSKPALSALDELRAEKIHAFHRERLAGVYVRQSTVQQVLDHQESTRLQYGLVSRAQALGWETSRILVIDDDLGKSGTSAQGRVGFQRLVSEVKPSGVTCSLPCQSAMSGALRERFSSTQMNRCSRSSGSSSGNLTSLVRYLASHQIQLGVRVREGPGKGELVWRRPNRATLQMMLKHPLYAGSYVYGRRQEDPRRKQPERPRTGRVVMATEEWLVLLPNRCPAYISPEQYERNQGRLAANRARADAMGAARAGSALLAGLVICARCDCRLNVHYDA